MCTCSWLSLFIKGLLQHIRRKWVSGQHLFSNYKNITIPDGSNCTPDTDWMRVAMAWGRCRWWLLRHCGAVEVVRMCKSASRVLVHQHFTTVIVLSKCAPVQFYARILLLKSVKRARRPTKLPSTHHLRG